MSTATYSEQTDGQPYQISLQHRAYKSYLSIHQMTTETKFAGSRVISPFYFASMERISKTSNNFFNLVISFQPTVTLNLVSLDVRIEKIGKIVNLEVAPGGSVDTYVLIIILQYAEFRMEFPNMNTSLLPFRKLLLSRFSGPYPAMLRSLYSKI